jgi:hypothetical protein
MKKIVLTYGFLAGGAFVIVLFIMTAMIKSANMGHSMLVGYASMLLTFLLIHFGMLSYRNNEGNGTISYGKAFQVGILITAIGCLCYAIAWVIIQRTMMPNFLEDYMNYELQQMKEKGASAAAIAAKSLEMNQYKHLYDNAITEAAITFLEPLPVGLLVTLVSSFIVSRKKDKTTSLNQA